ncbi:MAG: hypothetical protein M1820_007870 [Bogoriella megaspora]|nr:MAG: hypothetical protein M1820_007870 [Bogoriella megaspora]
MDRLPTELLSQMFACFDEREAAKAKRVCKAFDEHIRHHYPRRIVFARNEVSLRDISNIINTPYLRDSVTELVFDASRSNHHEIESGLEGYAKSCENHYYGRNLFGGQRSSQADSESDGTEDEYGGLSDLGAPSFISHPSDLNENKAKKKSSFWAYLERYQEEKRIVKEERD